MPSISAPDLALLRTGKHQATFYLSVLQPTALLSALVNNGSITRGARAIAYDTGTGSAGNFALIQEGQTLVVITADGTKKVRVKSITGNQVSGTITVDENAIDWANNQVISILHEYRIWPVAPRITGGVFYKFYDTAYSNQNSQPNPVAIAGPHRAGFLSAGSLAFAIDASDSYAIASGATISSYAWSCTGGTITNAAIATTTITFNTAGTYWLKLTVTDSNGKTQSTFRAIFVYDADNMPYTNFDVNNVTGSWQSGGYRAAFSVNGDVELSDFPDGTLVLLWYAGKINAVADYVNLWDVGDNVLFSGYIRTDNDTDDYTTGAGTVEFSTVSPEGILDEATEFGTVSITATAAPTTWYEYASWLTVGRAVHHLLRWHSTAFSCVDIYGLTDNTLGMESASFTEQNLLQQVNSLAFNRGHFAKLASDRTGRLHFATDSQYLNDAARAALDTVFSITNADISGAINVTRQPEGRIGYCDLDGFAFDGSTGTAFISLAPGYIDTISISMAEFTGIGGLPIKNQVLADQTDSNEKAGRALAVENRPIGEIRLEMPANYSGAFDIIPSIGWYDWGIANANLKRALALFGSNLICRQVENRIDVRAGTIQTAVILEPEALGADGIPGNYPTSYPTQAANPPDPDWTPPAAAIDGPLLVYTDNVTGYGSAVLLGIGPASIGTPVVFSDTDVTYRHAVAALSATKAIVCYANFTDSSYGRAQVLTISGTTIAPGTAISPESGAVNYVSVCALSDTQAIMAYQNVGLRVVLLNISGATVTDEAAVEVDASAGTIGISIARLSSTQAIVTYSDSAAANIGKTALLNVSGSTITPESPVTFENTQGVSETSVVALSSSQAVVTYERADGSDISVSSKVLGISGSTITPGAVADAFTAGYTNVGLQGMWFSYQISSTQFLIIAAESTVTPVYRIRSIVGTVAASAISYGSDVTLVTGLGAANSEPCVVIPEAGTAIFAYNDNGTAYVATIGIAGTVITDNDDDVTGFTGGNLSMTMLEVIS